MKQIDKNKQKAIDKFIKKLEERFGERLVSVVLFGSVARGSTRKESDIDLLLVIRNLPSDMWERDKLVEDITMDILHTFHEDICPILVDPKSLEKGMRIQNPLFYGMMLGYKVLYDRNNFFKRSLDILKWEIKKSDPMYVEGGKIWKLAQIV